MAGSIDALYGKGLARAQRALSRLEDPLQLDRERRRFTDLPPPYTSDRSGTTTQPASPDPPSEEQRLRQRNHNIDDQSGRADQTAPGHTYEPIDGGRVLS